MNIEEIREYCISKPGVTESFPFNDTALVFKVTGKMFALLDLSDESRGISLKCDPELAIELREQHPEVTPAWHFNKLVWNPVDSYYLLVLLNLSINSFQFVKMIPSSSKKLMSTGSENIFASQTRCCHELVMVFRFSVSTEG